ILNAWTRERSRHRGEFWRFEELQLYPRPAQRPHPPIWVAGTSVETLEWAGRRGFHIMNVAHPHGPEKVQTGVDAWKNALRAQGIDPASRHCQLHVRTHVNESGRRAREIAMPAITRYDEISRIGRKSSLTARPDEYDWDGMLAAGRNNYGAPD